MPLNYSPADRVVVGKSACRSCSCGGRGCCGGYEYSVVELLLLDGNGCGGH